MASLGVEGNEAERTPKNGLSRGNRQISTSRATTTNVTKYKGRYIGNVVLRHGGNVGHLKQIRGGSKANSRRAPEYYKCVYGLGGKADIRAGKVLSHASCEGRHKHDACSGLCRPCVPSQNMWPIDSTAQRPRSGQNRTETVTRENSLESGMETRQGSDGDKGTKPRARDMD